MSHPFSPHIWKDGAGKQELLQPSGSPPGAQSSAMGHDALLSPLTGWGGGDRDRLFLETSPSSELCSLGCRGRGGSRFEHRPGVSLEPHLALAPCGSADSTLARAG